jgi:hypothetical protein
MITLVPRPFFFSRLADGSPAKGDEENGKFFAIAIVIWQAESVPAPK